VSARRVGPLVLLAAACARTPVEVRPSAEEALAPVEQIDQDATPKEDARILPAEAYLRTYLQLFGGGTPLEVQRRARGDGGQLFDSWNDYAAALGLPDHRNDLPRATQTNALMVATFDRLAIALCARAAEHDLRGALPAGQRLVYAFEGVPRPGDRAAFAPLFDVLHRTFLGYPAALAPPARTDAFFRLFAATAARHEKANAPKARLRPVEAAWVSVCLGLARHPEFHTY
jgi:hypothetical protein